MKRWLPTALLLLGALALVVAVSAAADPGDKGKGKKQGHNRFTFTLTTDDHGSCGADKAPWANDTLTRTYVVHDNGDGTFRLRRVDKGTFTTIAGPSPGACEKKGKHGHTVRAGVTGMLVGYLEGTISGGTFNPKATCAAACFTSDFVTAFFGPNAQFSCFTNSSDCKFNFNYTAPKQTLLFRHWQDRGKGAGTMLDEKFKGDIANA